MHLRFLLGGLCLVTSLVASAADGDSDMTFASGGFAVSAVTAPFYVVEADAALAPDGSVLVASTAGVSNGSRATRFAVTRFDANGALDTGFGNNGVAQVDFSDGVADYPAYANALVRTPSGQWIVAGRVGDANNVGITRLHADGTLDSSFGTAGRTKLVFGAGNNSLYDVVVDAADRTWLLVGTIPSNSLIRLTPQGVPDPTFGNAGVLTLNAPCCYGFLALAFDAQGRILLGGTRNTNSLAMAVQRRLPDGSIDTTFANQGTFALAVNANSGVQRLLPTADGGLIALGNSGATQGGSMAKGHLTALRLTSSGQLDDGFGTAGISVVDFAGEENGLGFPDVHATLGTDGKILIARATAEAGAIRVARLLPNGQPDATFASDGKRTLLQSIGGLSFGRPLLAPGRLLLSGAYHSAGMLMLYAIAWQDGDGLFRDGLD